MSRAHYRHHRGKVFVIKHDGKEEQISAERAADELAGHLKGAENLGMGDHARQVSAECAAQLASAIRAAEIFNRISKPAPGEERKRMAAVKRSRKAERQAKGMRA